MPLGEMGERCLAIRQDSRNTFGSFVVHEWLNTLLRFTVLSLDKVNLNDSIDLVPSIIFTFCLVLRIYWLFSNSVLINCQRV